jgi:RNA recognition motif-containing protein
MTTSIQTPNQYESWESFISDPLDFSLNTPLTRLCSVEILTNTDWIDNLINPEIKPLHYIPTDYNDPLEDHSVEISNFDPEEITESDVTTECRPFGDIESIDLSQKRFGRIIVKFYDIRSAYAIVRCRIFVRGLKWIIQFTPSDLHSHPINQSRTRTIILFRIPQAIPLSTLHEEFSKFGEIREMREFPTHRFIEFWDSRSATQSIQATHGKKLFGVKLRVQLSRPSNYRPSNDRRLPTVTRNSKHSKREVKFECRYNFSVNKTV